jgi:hypothetical protein
MTIPVRRGAASEIRLNADCGPGGRIEADLLDAATGRTIAESLPIAGDVLSEAVRWKGAVSLAERDFQLRLRLSGQETRIYAIEFR